MAFAFLFDRPGPIASMARVSFFLTTIVPFLSAGAIWVWIAGPEKYSGLNLILRFFGFSPLRWLADPKLALMTVIGFTVWRGIGFSIMIYTAALRGIPAEYFDAATVDGASSFQRLRFITIPLLKSTTIFLLVVNMIGGWNAFTNIWFLTHGGPGSATRILTVHIYQYGFNLFKYGYAAATSVVLICIVLVFTYFRLRGEKHD
jgi:ABC-type sugar transport system permease subunit